MAATLLCCSMIGAVLPTLRVQQTPTSVWIPEEGAVAAFVGDRPTVACSIAGQPVKLLVDTGSTRGLLLSPAACERLASTLEERTGNASFAIPELFVGQAVFNGVPTAEAPFLDGSLGIDGVLGLPCFESCLLTFDFPRGLLRIDAGTLSEGPDVMTFTRDQEMGFGIVLDLDVAGVRVPAHLDTGSPELVLFSNLVRPELSLRGEPYLLGRASTPMGDADIFAAELTGTLRLGPLAFRDPEVHFADLPQIAGRRLGNVGMRMLSDVAITIDQVNGRLRIARETKPEEGAPSEKPARRLGAGFRQGGANGEQLTVASVLPGSAAERAGLSVDDRLLEVDGAPATTELLRRALAGDAAIVLVVERAGERKTLKAFGGT